jgi:hypothetical protein
MSANDAPMRASPASVAFAACVFLAANPGDWLTLADVCVNTGANEAGAARAMRRAMAHGFVRAEIHHDYGTVYHAGPALLKMAGAA